MLNRRTVLLGCAATMLIGEAGVGQEAVLRDGAIEAAQQRGSTLGAIAAQHGFLFGTCAHSRHLIPGSVAYDEPYRDLVLRECSLLVPEYGASPDSTRKSRVGFDFSLVDPLIDFAEQHGMAFGADHLVWHEAIPEWVRESITDRDAALEEMLLEVTTSAAHLASRVYYWVVANEVVFPSDGEPDGLRKSFWYEKIGPDYIQRAFNAAKAADPKALLLLNEYGVEADHPSDEKKRQALLRLLRSLRKSGVPIDGLGIESHLRGDRRINPDVLNRFLDEVYDLGLKIFVTELDVADAALPSDTHLRDIAVAQLVSEYLNVVTQHPGLQSITAWGLSDNHSWYNVKSTSAGLRRNDGLAARGTLFDSDLHPKPAYTAVRTALNNAPISKHR